MSLFLVFFVLGLGFRILGSLGFGASSFLDAHFGKDVYTDFAGFFTLRYMLPTEFRHLIQSKCPS